MNTAPTFGEALLRIAPADIHIPQRLGLYFPDKAAALGRLMAIHGQRTPITVRRSAAGVEQPWTLIVGMHRLNGAIIENLPTVVALERIGGTAADALDEEASENLDRREQPPLERAIFIAATARAAQERLAAIHGTSAQHKLAISARWARVKSGEMLPKHALQEEADDTCDKMSHVYGWVDSVASAFGRGKREIYRALTLYRMVIEPFPELTQALSDHPVVGNNASQLALIAGVDTEAARRKVIDLLLADAELSADDARVQAGIDRAEGREPTKFEKFTNQISGGLSRLSASEQKRGLPSIVGALKTEEVKRQLRDLLNEELGE